MKPGVRKWARILLIGAGLVIAAVLLYRPLAALTLLVTDPQRLQTLLLTYGLWGPAILAVLFILQTFLAFIPGQVLMVVSGYLYGFGGGLLITWFSLTLGGQMAFWLARRFGHPFVQRFVDPKLIAGWSRLTSRQGIPFYVITLFLPLFPNDAMCYLAGLETISPRRFLVANLLGRLIASSITTFVGAYGALFPWWGWGVILAGIVIVTVLGQIYRKRGMDSRAR